MHRNNVHDSTRQKELMVFCFLSRKNRILNKTFSSSVISFAVAASSSWARISTLVSCL
uniref:Uncharacterized protein n=1 Tax=Rhizophora mucronata TaxID=61149 RepID=A0A2P2JKY7_RHIMU